jgi:hypothetical protein
MWQHHLTCSEHSWTVMTTDDKNWRTCKGQRGLGKKEATWHWGSKCFRVLLESGAQARVRPTCYVNVTHEHLTLGFVLRGKQRALQSVPQRLSAVRGPSGGACQAGRRKQSYQWWGDSSRPTKKQPCTHAHMHCSKHATDGTQQPGDSCDEMTL